MPKLQNFEKCKNPSAPNQSNTTLIGHYKVKDIPCMFTSTPEYLNFSPFLLIFQRNEVIGFHMLYNCEYEFKKKKKTYKLGIQNLKKGPSNTL